VLVIRDARLNRKVRRWLGLSGLAAHQAVLAVKT
jgi:hypothetical protein